MSINILVCGKCEKQLTYDVNWDVNCLTFLCKQCFSLHNKKCDYKCVGINCHVICEKCEKCLGMQLDEKNFCKDPMCKYNYLCHHCYKQL